MLPPAAQSHLDTFWRGQHRRLALALHDDILYFWEPDSPQFQSAPEEWVFAVERQLCFADERQVTPELLCGELERALRSKSTGRRFQLADTLTVFLHEFDPETKYGEENSCVWFLSDEIIKWAVFDWSHEDLFDVPPSKWIERLENEAINGPGYYEGFADALSQGAIPYCRRHKAELTLLQGTQEQMNAMSEIIFRLAPAWVQQVDSRSDSLSGVGALLVLPLNRSPRLVFGGSIDGEGFVSMPHPCEELWDIWLDYFRPQPDAVFHQEGIANGSRLFSLYLDAYAGNTSDDSPWLRELSQHEQMETRLQLRDWLRDDVELGEDRIAELLG